MLFQFVEGSKLASATDCVILGAYARYRWIIWEAIDVCRVFVLNLFFSNACVLFSTQRALKCLHLFHYFSARLPLFIFYLAERTFPPVLAPKAGPDFNLMFLTKFGHYFGRPVSVMLGGRFHRVPNYVRRCGESEVKPGPPTMNTFKCPPGPSIAVILNT